MPQPKQSLKLAQQVAQIRKLNPISFWLLIIWLSLAIFNWVFAIDAQAIDLEATLLEPLSSWHWLGTDDLGRDVGLGILAGSHYAWLIGIGVCFLAGVGGLLLGGGAALLTYSYSQITVRQLVIAIVWAWLLSVIFIEYLRHSGLWQLTSMLVAGGLGIATLNKFWRHRSAKKHFVARRFDLPITLMFNYLVSFQGAVPSFVIALIISTFVPAGLFSVIFILSFTAWIPLARVSYFAVQHQLALPYNEAVQVLGIPAFRALWRHLLPGVFPQLITPLMQTFVFSILAEATLSFLGFGLAAEKITWGGMLASAKNNPSAWWLATFPVISLLSFSAAILHIAESFNQQKKLER